MAASKSKGLIKLEPGVPEPNKLGVLKRKKEEGDDKGDGNPVEFNFSSIKRPRLNYVAALSKTLVSNSRGVDTGDRPDTERASGFSYLASGAFRDVHVGTYDLGPRTGERCVRKTFKSGATFEDKFFDLDIKAMRKAAELIARFNQEVGAGRWVYVNECEVWEAMNEAQGGKNERWLIEPMIEGDYAKFNSNSGYVKDDTDFMQALSHFTYHCTNGEYVVCDLQGGRYPDCYVLTDPVVLSRRKEFGPTDLGQAGIENFFQHHVCGRCCHRHWKFPKKTASHGIVPVQSTSFSMMKVPTTVAQNASAQYVSAP